MDVVQVESEPNYTSEEEDTEAPAGQVVMTIQQPTMNIKKGKTLRFKGCIDQQEILILLDSSSLGTFISSELVEKLHLVLRDCDPVQFMSADGSAMRFDKLIP